MATGGKPLSWWVSRWSPADSFAKKTFLPNVIMLMLQVASFLYSVNDPFYFKHELPSYLTGTFFIVPLRLPQRRNKPTTTRLQQLTNTFAPACQALAASNYARPLSIPTLRDISCIILQLPPAGDFSFHQQQFCSHEELRQSPPCLHTQLCTQP